MKRSEIKAGAELYYDRRRDWELCGTGERAVVVDTGRYSPQDRNWRRRGQDPWREDSYGMHVLVDVYLSHPDSVKPHRQVVPLAHLRGEWTQCKQRVEELYQQRQQTRQLAETTRKAADQLASALQHRAGQLGIKVGKCYDETGTLKVSSQVLQQLLDAYEATTRQAT